MEKRHRWQPSDGSGRWMYARAESRALDSTVRGYGTGSRYRRLSVALSGLQEETNSARPRPPRRGIALGLLAFVCRKLTDARRSGSELRPSSERGRCLPKGDTARFAFSRVPAAKTIFRIRLKCRFVEVAVEKNPVNSYNASEHRSTSQPASNLARER